LITRAESVAAFPEIGRVVPEFRQPNLREVICRSYRVIYRLRRDEERIDIVRFWHGSDCIGGGDHGRVAPVT